MTYANKTKTQLIAELEEAHQHIAELKANLAQRNVSDHVDTAMALKVSEENYRNLVENSENAVSVLGRDGRVLYANPYGIRVWNDPQVVGKTIFDIYPAEYAARYNAAIQHVIDTQTSIVDEVKSLIKGRSMWFRLSMTPLKNPDGTVTTLLLNAWDLTERKQAEESLHESEERFRSLFEGSRAIMLMIEPDSGKILNANQAAGDFYGYSHEQLMTMNIAEINQFSPEEVLAERQKAKRDERNYFVFPHRLANGQIRTVEVYSHPIKIRDETLLYSIIFDITERKRSEILMYAQRDLARAIGKVTSNAEAWKMCLDTALKVSELDSGGIYLFHPSGDLLEVVHHQGLGDEFIRMVSKFTYDSQNVKMILSGLVFQFGSAEMEQSDIYKAEGLRSLICVPIHDQGQVIGCLNIASHTLDEIPFHARHALETIAAEIGNFVLYLRSESALRASEENFRLIAGSIDEVFWMSDPEINTMLYISPGYQQVWGRTPKSLYENPRSFIDAVIPEDQERVKTTLLLQKEGQPFSYEYHIQHTDGSVRAIWDRGYPVRDETGKVTRYVGVSQDITKRKQIETEKQLLFDTLNERAKDLTLLLNAGHELSETLDLQQIYEISYHYISTAVPCNILIISSFDPQSELITCEYLQNEEGMQDVSGFPSIPLEPPGKGTQSLVIRSGESLLLPDYVTALKTAQTSYIFDENAEIIEEPPDSDEELPRSAIIVPLKANGTTVGAFQILSHSLNAHTTDHLRFVEAFAFRVSAALSNARLFAELERRVQERTAEIENTRQRLELATQAAELGIWDWNIKTREFLWDQQMEVIHGKEAKPFQITLDNFLSIVHSEDRKSLSVYMKNRMENGANHDSIQYRVIHPNGFIRHVEVHAIVVRDAAGQPEHLIGVAQDITQEKVAEDALRQSEETYHALFDNSNDSIFLISPDGVEQMANRKALEILGYTLEEYLQCTNDQLVIPEERDNAWEKFQAVVRGENAPLYESTFLTKCGEKIEVEVNLSAIRDSNGHIFLVQSVVRDITQRKQAERALRESEERYRKAITAANAVPYSLDYKENIYTFIGEGIERITGYTRDEMTPSLFDSFIQETNMRGDLENIPTPEATKRVRAGEIPGNLVWCSDFRIKNKTGNNRWLSDISVQVLDEQENPVGSIGILQDITERKETEESLRRANIEMERALRVKDEFLASMSHELRTPLTGILGLSEALQYNTYGELNEKQRSILASVENSGHHLLDLINDILDISKMEAGKLELDIEPCSLSEVCQASIQLTKGMAQKKEQNIALSMDPASITVLGDHRRLKQILVNLLSNAIKYSPPKSPINLDILADLQAQTVSISISDKGIGIAPEDLKKLFRPFIQVDSSLSRQQTGTGLGLALVKRLVELHGGTLHVESTPGQGSCFTVNLVCPPPASIKQNNKSAESLQVQKALIIEDDTVDAEHLTRFLKIIGIKPTTHPSGVGAVEKVVKTKPDIILLDIHLHDLSGWDVLEQLKNNDNTRNIPVVITSVEEDHERATRLGAGGYLVKPIALPELNAALLRTQKNLTANSINQDNGHTEAALATIMLVDDNEINTFMIEDFLQSRNFKVVSAASGLEFLSKAPDVKPDLVLMDIQMPEIDGLETIRRLRLHFDPQLASVPVIAMTALAMPGDRERCLEAGANEYISKPIRLSELDSLILRTIEQAESRPLQ